MFRSNFDDFSGLGTTRVGPEQPRLITGPGWPGLVCSSYCLSSVLLKTILVEFWRLFRPRAPLEQVKLKTWLGWLSFDPKHNHIVCGAVLIVFDEYNWKKFRSNFVDFYRPEYHKSSQSSKSGPDGSVLQPRHTHFLGAILIIALHNGRKMLRLNFDDFSGLGTTGAGKVENWDQMTRCSARNIPTRFWVQFLLFPIIMTKQCFGRILTTFPCPGTTRAGQEQAKLINGPGCPDFAPEIYPHFLGSSSYHLSSMLLKNVLVEFWWLFRARVPL